jgi:uncharacterized protein (TIGR03437 family)
MMPPQIIEVFHAASGNQPPKPVTHADPAAIGETLTLYATGLGPVRDPSGTSWPIGQLFPPNDTVTVISPVTITIGNVAMGHTKSTVAPQSAQGVPGFSNGYAVEFVMPDVSILAITRATTIQISSAWIQSAEVTLYVA